MAIADFEPTDAAAIVLDYKLSEVLAEGQIHNLSHEMLREKVSENYSDIFIHKPYSTLINCFSRPTMVSFQIRKQISWNSK